MEEIWQPVPGTRGLYEVSSEGKVRCRLDEDIRAVPQFVDGTGYPTVRICSTTRRVHRLVARAFIPGVGRLVRHLNDVKEDNRLDNLAWGSDQQNIEDHLDNIGHYNSHKTECPLGHPLVGINVTPTVRGDGRVFRQCKACMRAKAAILRLKLSCSVDFLARVYLAAWADGVGVGQGSQVKVRELIERYGKPPIPDEQSPGALRLW